MFTETSVNTIPRVYGSGISILQDIALLRSAETFRSREL